MDGRGWVSNIAYGYDESDGFNRCACGCGRFSAACHTYEGGGRGYFMSCRDCGRRVEVDGTEDDLVDAWNDMNDGACEVAFRVVEMPDELVVYVKRGERVDDALKELLFSKTKMEKVFDEVR